MIIATFTGDDEPYSTVTDDVWQYDYGQVLQIEGLTIDDVTELDFATSTTATYAYALAGVKIADTVMQVTIPDEFLRNDYKKQDFNIYVWVFVIAGDSGETTHRIQIPVKTRPRRDEYEYDPDTEANPFDDAIAAVNGAAQRAGNSATEAAESASTASDYADSAAESAASAAEASDYAQQIYELLQVAIGNFKSVTISKDEEAGVTTLIITDEEGEHIATINDGISAYEVAVKNGYVGTEEEWLASLKGEKGDKGDTGQGANIEYDEESRVISMS